jgi:hypothetical protein
VWVCPGVRWSYGGSARRESSLRDQAHLEMADGDGGLGYRAIIPTVWACIVSRLEGGGIFCLVK